MNFSFRYMLMFSVFLVPLMMHIYFFSLALKLLSVFVYIIPKPKTSSVAASADLAK